MDAESRQIITGIIARSFRSGGFIGDVNVTRVRRTTRGYSARVTATQHLHRAEYAATVVGGKVTCTRTSDPVRLTA